MIHWSTRFQNEQKILPITGSNPEYGIKAFKVISSCLIKKSTRSLFRNNKWSGKFKSTDDGDITGYRAEEDITQLLSPVFQQVSIDPVLG